MSLDQFLLSASTTDLNYPEIRPSLDLNFARTKTLDPRITFTRSSGGSYVGADGLIKYAGVNEARFDHNPVTRESLGLLVEQSRANLLGYSEDLSEQIAWIRVDSSTVNVIPNNTISPDGSANADLVVNQGAIISLLAQNVVVSPSSTTDYYASVYAKRGTSSTFTFNCYYVGNIEDNVIFNFDTGAVTAVPYPGEYIFQDVGNGWYRCGFRMTRDSTGSRTNLLFRFWQSGRGNTTGNTYFWGPQLEVGGTATSYIPTVASQRTRAADDASITGTNFLSWYKQIGYTILTNSIVPRYPEDFPRVFNISVPSTGDLDRLNHYHFFTTTGFSAIENNNLIAVMGTVPGVYTTGGDRVKMVTRYEVNNTSLFINGLFIGNDNVVSNNVTRTSFKIGSTQVGGAYLNSTIANITYYPKALPDAQLQALSR